jgi:hypothetical protein
MMLGMGTPCMELPGTEGGSTVSGLPDGVTLASPSQLLLAAVVVPSAAAAAAAAALAAPATGVLGTAEEAIAHVCTSRG